MGFCEDENEIEQDYSMQASMNSNGGMSDITDSQTIRSTDKLTYLYALNLSLFAANTETYLKELVTFGKSQSFKSRQRSPSQALSNSALMQISDGGAGNIPSSNSNSGSSSRSPVKDCGDCGKEGGEGAQKPTLEISEAATLTNASSHNSPSIANSSGQNNNNNSANCAVNDIKHSPSSPNSANNIVERQSSEDSNKENNNNAANANAIQSSNSALHPKKIKEIERYYLKLIVKYYEKSHALFKSLEQRHTTSDKSLYSDYLNAIISRLVKLRPHRRLSSSDNNGNNNNQNHGEAG